MSPDFNRFEFFTEAEMTLLALKFRGENKKLRKLLEELPKQDMDLFFYKFFHAFVVHQGEENEQELITKFLSRYR